MMQYGFATGFASDPPFSLDFPLVTEVLRAGFDFPEFPVTGLWKASSCQRARLDDILEGRRCPVMCNFFPPSIRLLGKDRDDERIKRYLGEVLPVLQHLGVGRIVLGSSGSRMLPEGMEKKEADEQFATTLREVVLPACKGMALVLLEPLNRQECNYGNTVQECAKFVRMVDDPGFQLMIDLYHMERNGESLSVIKDVLPLMHHVHIAQTDRILPGIHFSPYLEKGIRFLQQAGYDESISYETVNGNLGLALRTLSKAWESGKGRTISPGLVGLVDKRASEF
jgi:sugar phosphate isomerase/epimerase